MPYVFYDTETTDVSTAFAQILQFAAIKTDDDLNEIERFEIRSRLLPHVIPSPKASAKEDFVLSASAILFATALKGLVKTS